MSSVWLITGAQAAGKSTVADLLARHFERGVHVRGYQFARWAVSGWTAFDADDADDARRLLDLRYRLSALVADEYAAAGFTTVVQDNIYGADVERWVSSIAARPLNVVVLRPAVTVLSARDEARRLERGKVAYRGDYTPARNDADIATTPRHVGLWLDTSEQSPEESVREILTRRAEAEVSRRSAQ
jgi:adenylylsulfate kinase-like enzyme